MPRRSCHGYQKDHSPYPQYLLHPRCRKKSSWKQQKAPKYPQLNLVIGNGKKLSYVKNGKMVTVVAKDT